MLCMVFMLCMIFMIFIKYIPINIKPEYPINIDSIKYKKLKQKRLKSKEFPLPYPNSWYYICDSKDIKKGEKFTKNNIKVVRPSFGLEPKLFNKVLGKKAKINLKFSTPLKWSHVKNK